MKLFLLIQLFGVFIFSLGFPASGYCQNTLDGNATEFSEKLRTSPHSGISFQDSDNAFYPYRHEHFDAGLSPSGKARLKALQEAGDCGPELGALLIEGFLGLHPNLRPVFADPNWEHSLKVAMTYGPIAPVRRCTFHRDRNNLRQKVVTSTYDPIDLNGGEQFAHLHRPPGDRGVYWDQLFGLMFHLGDLAFCEDYPSSIADLMLVTNKPGGQVLTRMEAVYLSARAKTHGLINDSQADEVIQQLALDANGRSLFELAQTVRLTDLPPIPGFWQAGCR